MNGHEPYILNSLNISEHAGKLTAEQVSPASAKDLQLAAPAHSEVQ